MQYPSRDSLALSNCHIDLHNKELGYACSCSPFVSQMELEDSLQPGHDEFIPPLEDPVPLRAIVDLLDQKYRDSGLTLGQASLQATERRIAWILFLRQPGGEGCLFSYL